MILIPITLKEANEFVDQFHRHQKKVANNGGKFAIACGSEDDGLIGVAIVGNPVSASIMDGFTALESLEHRACQGMESDLRSKKVQMGNSLK